MGISFAQGSCTVKNTLKTKPSTSNLVDPEIFVSLESRDSADWTAHIGQRSLGFALQWRVGVEVVEA